MRRGFAVLVVLSAGLACNESTPAPFAPPAPLAVDSRVSNTTCLATKQPIGKVRLEVAYDGFESPVEMVDRGPAGLLYVAELKGRIKVLDRTTGLVSTALDLVGRVSADSEQGLLSLTFHPTKPHAYVTVLRDAEAGSPAGTPSHSEVLRFTTHDGGRTYDPASEKLILRVDRPGTAHALGTVAFGPDGFLYIASGDGGSNYTPELKPYDPSRLLGAILRLDVDGGDPYAIPADNPYVSGGGRPEIYAGGLRNPWRFTFDRVTGELWAGDVGEISFEEINKVEKGKNYGWPTVEASKCFKPRALCDTTGLTPPLFAYAHDDGAAIIGGYVYRGTAMPDLVGKYIYGDVTNGHIWALEGEGAALHSVLLNTGGPAPTITSFSHDADGELYVLDLIKGTIFKLLKGETNPAPRFPALLSQTGCVDPKAPGQPAPGLVPYDVNVSFWSDGAEKERYFAIPDGTSIHVMEDGDFDLPPGSVVMKTLSFGGKRIETRLLRNHPDGAWSGTSYEWNDAQTDAVLLDEAKDKVLPNGQTWSIPSPSQCFRCHTKIANITLGLEALQLNRERSWAPSRSSNQLTRLSTLGYFDQTIDASKAGALPDIASLAKVDDRARAYLHANCSICHRPGGANTNSPIDARFQQPLSALAGCASTFGGDRADVTILAPGRPEQSGIFIRMSSRNDLQMPPLATHVFDREGTALIESWIRGLQKCD